MNSVLQHVLTQPELLDYLLSLPADELDPNRSVLTETDLFSHWCIIEYAQLKIRLI